MSSQLWAERHVLLPLCLCPWCWTRRCINSTFRWCTLQPRNRGNKVAAPLSLSKNCGAERAVRLIIHIIYSIFGFLMFSLALTSETSCSALKKQLKCISVEFNSAQNMTRMMIYLGWHNTLMKTLDLTELNKVISPTLTKCLRMLWFVWKCEIEWTGKFSV